MSLELKASRVTWIAAYRGPYGRRQWLRELMDDWKVLDYIGFPEADSQAPENGGRHKSAEEDYYRRARDRGRVDDLTRLALVSAGKSRVHRLKADTGQNEDAEWPVLDRSGNTIVSDRMLAITTLSDSAESYIVIDRPPEAPPFSDREARDALVLVTSFPRLHHWLLLERGLIPPATRPFSPRQRDVLRLMLEPLSEQDIADLLGLTRGAVHNYAVQIYRNLDVSSRAALLALWLGQVSEC